MPPGAATAGTVIAADPAVFCILAPPDAANASGIAKNALGLVNIAAGGNTGDAAAAAAKAGFVINPIKCDATPWFGDAIACCCVTSIP